MTNQPCHWHREDDLSLGVNLVCRHQNQDVTIVHFQPNGDLTHASFRQHQTPYYNKFSNNTSRFE